MPKIPRALATLLALVTFCSARAQQTSDPKSDPSQTAKQDSGKKAENSSSAQEQDAEKGVVTLSPFRVTGENTHGYWSKQSLSGSRTVVNLIDLPTSITVINAEQLADLNATNIWESIQFGTAGVTQNSRTTNMDLNIRGFRSESVMVDGQFQKSANPEYYDVDSVEVIKGPTNMLMGTSGFIGGAVNLVTRQPTSTPQASISATVGRYNYIRGAANVSGPAYKSDSFNFNYRVTVGRLTGETPKEIENYDQKFIGFGLAFEFPKSQSRLDVVASHLWDGSYIYYDDFLDASRSTPSSDPTKLVTAYLHPLDTKSFSSAQSQYTIRDTSQDRLKLLYTAKLSENGYLKIQYQWTRNKTPLQVTPRPNTMMPDNITLRRLLFVYALEQRAQLGQIDYTHKLTWNWFTLDTTGGVALEDSFNREGVRLAWMPDMDVRNPSAAYAADAAFFANGTTVRLPYNNPFWAEFGASDNENFSRGGSGYLQETLTTLNDKLLLTAGWRKGFPHPVSGSKNDITGTSSSSVGTGKRKLQYKYGIVVKPLPWISAYYTDAANVSSRNGRRSDLDTPGDQLGPVIPDQEGLLHEYGVKLDRELDENTFVHFTASHYYVALTSVQVHGFLRSGIAGDVYSARDSTKGWEFEGNIVHQFATGRITALTAAGFGDSDTALQPGFQAHQFVKTKYSLWAKYDWTSGPLTGLWFGGGALHLDQHRESAWIVPGHNVYNAVIGYKMKKHWDFQLNLDHLENKRYITGIFATGLVDVDGGFSPRFQAEYKF